MQKTTKILAILLLAFSLLLTGCKEDPLIIEEPSDVVIPNILIVSDTVIVIKTTEEAMGGKTDMLLVEYMENMREEGLKFEVNDGMIVSINGIANPADYSSCWMLYTSDAENSNAAWGTVEYEGNEYGSAISGAETLKIKANEIYIWVFKSFS